jgi:hypothetical protein
MPDHSDPFKRLAKLQQIEEQTPAAPEVPSQDELAGRLARLNVLRLRMDAGNDVARRDLKNALTVDEWARYEQSDSFIRSGHLGARPSVLDTYIEMLRKADFYHSRAESTLVTDRSRLDHHSRPGRHRLHTDAETAYEKAVEYLAEQLNVNTHNRALIEMWLDRPVDMTPGYEPSLDPISMPRVRGSRSVHCLTNTEPTIFDQKRKNKYTTLLDAIERIKQYL